MSRPRFGAQRLLSPSVLRRLQFRLLGVADPAHWLHHHYLERALTRADPSRIRAVLDAGCGAGDYSMYLAARYPAAEVLGVDLNPDRMETLRANAAALSRRGDPGLVQAT